MLEKFFLKQRKITIENWQIGLFLLVAVVGLVGFGALVEIAASDPHRSNLAANTSLKIARLPAETKHVMKTLLAGDHAQLTRKQRFDGQAGFSFPDDAYRPKDIVVLSRYDFDARRSVAELLDIESRKVIHRFEPDFAEINSYSKLATGEVNFARDHHAERYMITHPVLEADGSLVFQGMGTPLVKVDACSNVQWTIDGQFHHAIEKGPDGAYWTAKLTTPSSVPLTAKNFADDTLVQVSPDGEILLEKSIGMIFLENDLEYLVYTGDDYTRDPFHLNDVQPVFEDGPFWKKGDLFLSLRNLSAIVQYRPSTNKVIWYQEGPWLGQHDVDIISDHEISVFNNHTAVAPGGGEFVLESNEVHILDFSTGEVRSPYKDAFVRNNVKTVTDGLSTILENGDVFVEEQNFGRLVVLSPEGDVRWSYVNRASNGKIYHLQWSRYLEGQDAANARAAIESKRCS